MPVKVAESAQDLGINSQISLSKHIAGSVDLDSSSKLHPCVRSLTAKAAKKFDPATNLLPSGQL